MIRFAWKIVFNKKPLCFRTGGRLTTKCSRVLEKLLRINNVCHKSDISLVSFSNIHQISIFTGIKESRTLNRISRFCKREVFLCKFFILQRRQICQEPMFSHLAIIILSAVRHEIDNWLYIALKMQIFSGYKIASMSFLTVLNKTDMEEKTLKLEHLL